MFKPDFGFQLVSNPAPARLSKTPNSRYLKRKVFCTYANNHFENQFK
jgi:hypothetical protein